MPPTREPPDDDQPAARHRLARGQAGSDISAEPDWPPRCHIVAWASAALVATAGLLLVSVALGLFAPRASTDSWAWAALRPESDLVHMAVRMTNDAWASTELAGGGESAPGLRLVATTVATGDDAVSPDAADLAAGLERDDPIAPDGPVSFGHGETATLTLVWQVTDCAVVPAHAGPIPVRLRTPLGLSRSVDGPDDLGIDTPWTVAVARDVCGQPGDAPES
jgi:hypothetical protein